MENLVYHYTNLDSLRGILRKELCLWASHYLFMNDPSEQTWAQKYVLELIKKLSDYHERSDKDLIGWFGKESYILSLCKKPDDRTMWRLYCNDGMGVCLILNRDIIKEYCRHMTINDPENSFFIVEDVEYSTADEINNVVDKCRRKECFSIMNEEEENHWMRMVPFIKNADFDVEDEVRCAILRETDKITVPYDKETDRPGHFLYHVNDNNCMFRMRGNELVPYIEIHFPTEALEGIILGYKVNEEKARKYIDYLMRQNETKYRNLIISKSELFSSEDQEIYNNKL